MRNLLTLVRGAASPLSADAIAATGRLHLEAGNNAAAALHYQRCLALHPSHPESLHGMALIAFGSGEFAMAHDLARKATRGNNREPAYFNTLGRALRAMGRNDEAAKAYRKALAIDPGVADVHVSLGIVQKALGDLTGAVASYRRALSIAPSSWAALHNLANVLALQGETAVAVQTYEQVLVLNPVSGEAQFELSNLLYRQGKRDQARQGYARAIELGMRGAQNWIALGDALAVAGQAEDALQSFRRAAEAEPANAAARYRLAGALYDRRELDQAIEAFAHALDCDGVSAEGLVNLGIALRERGRREQAIDCFQRALQAKPALPEAHLNLGNTLNDLEQYMAAEAAFTEAIRLAPGMAEAHANLGFTRRSLGDYADALRLTRHALALAPDSVQGCNNLGLLAVEIGDAPGGERQYLRALEMRPDYVNSRSNLLMALNYGEGADVGRVVEAHREFERRHAIGLKAAAPARRRGVSKLRIGYVSADLRRHSVAHFAEPVLSRHDKSRFEVVCYYNHVRSDEVTARFKSYADQWVECAALSDEELAERVRADGIDVLIDLGGHTAGNRLLAFARKPAPVQMTWLGYPTTTGLSAIDYRITDWQVDPEGYERHNAEKPLRLPSSYFCYRPPQDSPEVGELPALGNGHITFGSFNNLAKVSEATVALWSRVLEAVPGAKLLMKTKALADETVRLRIIERFAARGIDAARLELIGWEAQTASHLAIYNRVDIALDTWPYNGATTTCEALWMGVPVVTLAGPTHAARMGASILNAAGIADFATANEEQFTRIALSWSRSGPELAILRQHLRARLIASPLMDESRFASAFEAVVIRAWET